SSLGSMNALVISSRLDLRESKLRLRVDQSRVHGHAAYVNHTCVFGNLYGTGRADRGDLSVLYDEHSIFDRPVAHREELSAAQNHRLLLSRYGDTEAKCCQNKPQQP